MANTLTQFLHLPSGARRRKRSPELVTVLDLDGTTLRIAQASSNESLRLVAVAALEMAPEADRTDPVTVGAAVSRALAKLGLKPTAVVMGLARSCVVLRNLRLPVMENLPEMASVVHFQMAKDLPFPAEQAVIDFTVGREVFIPKEKTEASKPEAGEENGATVKRVEVLVAAVKRDVVEFHQALAKAAGLKLSALGLLSYANCRCLEACKITEGEDAVALLCLRSDEVSVDVIAHRSLLFSRGAFVRPVGETPHMDGAVPVTPEAFVQAAAIESVRSLHGYAGAEPNAPVGKVFVAGSTGLEGAMLEALKSLVSVPCTQLDPSEALRLAPDLRTAATGSIGAIGLALGFGDEFGLPFDFLNPKRPAVPRDLRRIAVLSGTVAAVALLMALLAVRKVLIDKRTAALREASVELSQAEKDETLYRTLVNHATVVGDWVKGGRDWLQHYAYLASVLPPSEEVYLTSLAVDNQGTIRLAVQARSGETLAQLDKQLRAAGYDVKPVAINPGADSFGYEFRSTVEMAASPKIKIDLHKLSPVSRPADDVSLDAKAWKRGGK
jgi:Tfp pilus assembly PilM family ATPase